MLTIEVEFHFGSKSMEDNSKYFPLSSFHGFYGNEEGSSGMFSQGTPSHLFYQYPRPMHWPQSSPNATQSSSSSLSNASCSRSQSPNGSTASEDTITPRRSYNKWTEEQELFLIDLWAEYDDELKVRRAESIGPQFKKGSTTDSMALGQKTKYKGKSATSRSCLKRQATRIESKVAETEKHPRITIELKK